MRPGETPMQNLGAFGEILLTDGADVTRLGAPMMGMMGGMGRGGMAGMGGGYAYDKPLAAAPTAMGPAMAKAAAPAGGENAVGLAAILVPTPGQPPVQPAVRTNFADTAFWAAALTTAADGTAEVEFPLPESLTTWKVKTWTMGLGTTVGQGDSEIVTTKDLLVRLQAPGSSSRRTRSCCRPTSTTSSRRTRPSRLCSSSTAACSSR